MPPKLWKTITKSSNEEPLFNNVVGKILQKKKQWQIMMTGKRESSLNKSRFRKKIPAKS